MTFDDGYPEWDESYFTEIVETKIEDNAAEIIHEARGYFMTIKEAADFAKVSEKTVRRWIAKGQVGIMQPGGRCGFVRVSVTDILAMNR